MGAMGRRKKETEISFQYFQLFAFGSDVELTEAFGDLGRAEAAWRSVRDRFLEGWNLWGMPSAWWRFEAGVPDDLRSGPHAIITERDMAEWDRIEAARRRYLAELGMGGDPPRPRTPSDAE